MSDEIIIAVLRFIFGHEGYVTMFEVIDDDMIRKDAIEIKKRKEYEFGDCVYWVKINWRLLDKYIEHSFLAKKEEVTHEEIEHYKKAGAILRGMEKEEYEDQ